TYSDQQRRALEGQLANLRDVAIPAALAAALAASNIVARNLARTTARCIDPLCGAFGSQVDLFNLLNTGALVALVMGLVASAINDPEGSSRQVAAGGDGLYSLGSGLLGAVGVRL
ncbi:MAG: hypothetical protein ACRDHD_11415, partial [Candidatus Limnocylindria bacterium]